MYVCHKEGCQLSVYIAYLKATYNNDFTVNDIGLICQQMSCAADSRCWKIIVLETIGECEKAVLLNLCVAAAVLEIGSLVAVCVF